MTDNPARYRNLIKNARSTAAFTHLLDKRAADQLWKLCQALERTVKERDEARQTALKEGVLTLTTLSNHAAGEMKKGIVFSAGWMQDLADGRNPAGLP